MIMMPVELVGKAIPCVYPCGKYQRFFHNGYAQIRNVRSLAIVHKSTGNKPYSD